VRRNALPVAALAAAFLALCAGLAATAWQAREAERARQEAELQRGRAQKRFDDVRRLATSFVFEFHDAIAPLAGATAARQLVVGKGLEYLDRLAADARQDRSLRLELADAYERLGDIQGNPLESNVGDARASLASIQKAAAIRQSLSGSAEPQSAEGLAVARSLLRLGDAYQAVGRSRDAVELYRRVAAEGEAALRRGGGAAVRQNVAQAGQRLCGILMAVGDSEGALENCRNSVRASDALLSAQPASAALAAQAAASTLAYANALRLSGRVAEALPLAGKVTGQLQRLAEENAADGRVRLQLATALAQRGNIQAALGRQADAVASYQEAVERLDALLAADPANQRVRTLLSYLLLRRSPALLRAGRRTAAAASTRRGLGLLREQAERAAAAPTDMNEYAQWLLTCQPASERRPAEALRFARRAVDAQPQPLYLDTLALAYFQTGAREQAVRAEERALALLPPAAPRAPSSGLRREIESRLAEFRGRPRGGAQAW